MKKIECVKAIAEKTQLSQKDVAAVIAAFEDVIMEDVFAKEDSLRLAFGTFSGYTKVTNTRKGRNPQTGEELTIEGKTMHGYPKVKFSKSAKECDE